MPNTAASWLHVVAAVIYGHDGKVLLARRLAKQHQGGKWEFPGGKLETGETPLQGLRRELREELGIELKQAQPLIKVRHVYPERAVLLDVWSVSAFDGKPYGREGQPVEWFSTEQLSCLEFPPANRPIVTAACLPESCLITPEPHDVNGFLQNLQSCLRAGIRLVQFRAKTLAAREYAELARKVIELTHAVDGKVILNTPPIALPEADGVHVSSTRLMMLNDPAELASLRLGEGKWLCAACHNLQELHKAAQIGVDFAFLSPVLPTRSHPGAAALEWGVFQQWVDQVNFPVYALGGMSPEHVSVARVRGGQGIAAIRSLWGGLPG